MKSKKSRKTSGIVRTDPDGRNIFVVESPDGGSHSWAHEWVRAVIRAYGERDKGLLACACTEILPGIECTGGPHAIDFALGHPGQPSKEGSIVVASYESGGEVLRFSGEAWKVVGYQPARKVAQ